MCVCYRWERACLSVVCVCERERQREREAVLLVGGNGVCMDLEVIGG